MTFTTWIASLFAGVWRVVLTPLDTCKTVLQVEGPKGFASLMKKVNAASIGVATTHGVLRLFLIVDTRCAFQPFS